jgi:DoxX-like family
MADRMEVHMDAAYTAVTLVAATALAYAAYLNFSRDQIVLTAARRVQVSEEWIYPFGTILAAGALGLLLGLAIPWLGIAASVGVVAYFICAVAAHLRVNDRHVGAAIAFLCMGLAALVVGLAHRGAL